MQLVFCLSCTCQGKTEKIRNVKKYIKHYTLDYTVNSELSIHIVSCNYFTLDFFEAQKELYTISINH